MADTKRVKANVAMATYTAVCRVMVEMGKQKRLQVCQKAAQISSEDDEKQCLWGRRHFTPHAEKFAGSRKAKTFEAFQHKLERGSPTNCLEKRSNYPDSEEKKISGNRKLQTCFPIKLDLKNNECPC